MGVFISHLDSLNIFLHKKIEMMINGMLIISSRNGLCNATPVRFFSERVIARTVPPDKALLEACIKAAAHTDLVFFIT